MEKLKTMRQDVKESVDSDVADIAEAIQNDDLMEQVMSGRLFEMSRELPTLFDIFYHENDMVYCISRNQVTNTLYHNMFTECMKQKLKDLGHTVTDYKHYDPETIAIKFH